GAFMVGSVAFAGGWFLGGSRTVLSVQAPTHDGVAMIAEGHCAAGRCQTLRVGPDASSTRVVESLSGAEEQATEIVWTGDGGRVGFLVNGYQLRVFDAHTG